MTKAEDILKNRIEYFKNKEFEKIYDIYSINSEFKQYFCDKESYKEHFFKLIENILPVSIEIYKVLYNNNSAEILFLEKAKHLESDNIINFYSKAYFIMEENMWKIIKEERESSNNKGY